MGLSKQVVLTGYPLSLEFRGRLEAAIGEASSYLHLAELRALGPAQMLKQLATLRADRLLLPLEDINSMALLPILEMLAAVSHARERVLVTPELTFEPIGRARAVAGFGRFLAASATGQTAVKRARRELTRLLAEPLQPLRPETPDGARRVQYLKTNLWFGVKAGGSVGHVAGVANGLYRLGYAVDFVSAEPPTMVDAGVGYHRVAPPAAYGVPFEANYYHFNHTFIEQTMQLGLPKPAFIYQRLSVANYAGPVLARALGVPLVIEYNGSEAWIAKHWGRPLRYHDEAVMAEDACLKHAQAVVVVSDVLRDELIERGVAPERIVSYPNCIDPELFDPARYAGPVSAAVRSRHGIAADAVVATFIGTFGQWHGVDVLAQAIRRMVDEDAAFLDRHRLHFMLVGDGLKMPEVKRLLDGDRYRPYVTLTGLVAQHLAPEYLAASDLLLSPHVPNADGSRFFGSPTKLFEYMAMGKGIVASDLEQIGQVLRHSVRADAWPASAPEADESRLSVLTTPGDVDALIEGIRFLVERPDWRVVLGRNARREALERYTWESHVQAILDRLEVAGPTKFPV